MEIQEVLPIYSQQAVVKMYWHFLRILYGRKLADVVRGKDGGFDGILKELLPELRRSRSSVPYEEKDGLETGIKKDVDDLYWIIL